MTSPLPTLFGRHQTKQLDLNRPEGCDHDQNIYHYRLVDGQMVLRGIVLGHRWEHRPMSWQTLSCYKCKEDDSMAVITKESVKPKPRADKAEILTNAKELMDGGQSLSETARILGVPLSTLHSWIAREKKRAANARKVLESVDAGKTIKPMSETVLSDKATEVVICADCGKEIAGCVFTGKGHGPRCFKCAVTNGGQVVTAPIGVEVPQYEPEDDDYLDGEPVVPQVVEKPFDANAFRLEVIENIIEMSGLRNAPKEITLSMISGVMA